MINDFEKALKIESMKIECIGWNFTDWIKILLKIQESCKINGGNTFNLKRIF